MKDQDRKLEMEGTQFVFYHEYYGELITIICFLYHYQENMREPLNYLEATKLQHYWHHAKKEAEF